MRAPILALAAAATGCNAIFGLDETSLRDASTCPMPGDADFVDEDGDDVDDSCDRCPVDADPDQVDGDDDGVGDACDLTDTPTRIAFFDGFHAPLSALWQSSIADQWEVVDDAAELQEGTGLSTLTVKDLDLGDGRVDASITVRAVPTAPDHTTGVLFVEGTAAGYLCAATRATATTDAEGLLARNSTLARDPLTGQIPLGDELVPDRQLELDARFSAADQECRIELAGITSLLVAEDTTLTTGTAGIYAQGLSVRVQHVIVYEELR